MYPRMTEGFGQTHFVLNICKLTRMCLSHPVFVRSRQSRLCLGIAWLILVGSVGTASNMVGAICGIYAKGF